MPDNILVSDGIIGGVVGAVGTYLFTLISDANKENKANKALRKLILTDLQKQNFELEILRVEALNIYHVLHETHDFNPVRQPYMVSDTIFKSNTYLQYHQAFDDSEFNQLINIYDWVGIFKSFDTREYYLNNLDRLNAEKLQIHIPEIPVETNEQNRWYKKIIIKEEIIRDLEVKMTNLKHLRDRINDLIKEIKSKPTENDNYYY